MQSTHTPSIRSRYKRRGSPSVPPCDSAKRPQRSQVLIGVVLLALFGCTHDEPRREASQRTGAPAADGHAPDLARVLPGVEVEVLAASASAARSAGPCHGGSGGVHPSGPRRPPRLPHSQTLENRPLARPLASMSDFGAVERSSLALRTRQKPRNPAETRECERARHPPSPPSHSRRGPREADLSKNTGPPVIGRRQRGPD